MTIAPDPAEITPPHSSDAYVRRRGLGLWAVLAMCAVSLAAGIALATLGPHWWPSRETERPFAAATPASNPAVTRSTVSDAPGSARVIQTMSGLRAIGPT